jgi:hypothetical protein
MQTREGSLAIDDGFDRRPGGEELVVPLRLRWDLQISILVPPAGAIEFCTGAQGIRQDGDAGCGFLLRVLVPGSCSGFLVRFL